MLIDVWSTCEHAYDFFVTNSFFLSWFNYCNTFASAARLRCAFLVAQEAGARGDKSHLFYILIHLCNASISHCIFDIIFRIKSTFFPAILWINAIGCSSSVSCGTEITAAFRTEGWSLNTPSIFLVDNLMLI